MAYNLLVVTDHNSHQPTNSLYQLAKAMLHDQRCDHVWVCSKGVEVNHDFFGGKSGSTIYAVEIDDSFSYDPAGSIFQEHSNPIRIEAIDAILIRMPQPPDPAFLFSLERLVPPDRIINRPEGIMKTSSKEFLMEVAFLCPNPFMCYSLAQAMQVSARQEIVLKPLYSYGGHGIARLSSASCWNEHEEMPIDQLSSFLRDEHFPMLGMPFLKNVTQGDKRTIVANGFVIGSALRLPPPGSWMCNVAQGGHAKSATADDDEQRIEKILTPMLMERGIILYAFDTLVGDDGHRVLSEINTLSIGGLTPLEELTGRPVVAEIATQLWDYLEKRDRF